MSGHFSLNSGLNAAPYFAKMEQRPTAVFCMNDEMAIGLIQSLKTEGLSVPEDISIAGFDDIEFAKYCDPALTTIAQPAEEMDRVAISVLYGLLKGRTDNQMKHTLPHRANHT
ncbi:MAG: substrate-binding domain-containing protein [Porticoccaceae bacterium]|nr:substrate-binding domain-containing protein [Porticoccaceae bacterium]